MPLMLIAFYLLCADAILLAEGIGSSLVIVLAAVLAAVLATVAHSGGVELGRRRRL